MKMRRPEVDYLVVLDIEHTCAERSTIPVHEREITAIATLLLDVTL